MSTSVASDGLDQDSERFSQEKQILKNAGEVPNLPNTAYQLLLMSIDDRVNARDVINIIKSDPGLAARLIRYSKSAYFGYRGEIASVEQAVVSVLGLSLTINIALGITLGNQFSRSNAGPMGLHEFWRHSINHALLMQAMSSRIPNRLHVNPELAYLCGLLHDFGVLIIGQVNRRQSILLNEMIKANPNSSRLELENQILGYCHTNIGASLLQQWRIPQAVVEVAANHHMVPYHGKYEAYVNLTTLVDYALQHYLFAKRRHGDDDIPGEIQAILGFLNLTVQDVKELCTHLEIMENDLSALADQLIG